MHVLCHCLLPLPPLKKQKTTMHRPRLYRTILVIARIVNIFARILVERIVALCNQACSFILLSDILCHEIHISGNC